MVLARVPILLSNLSDLFDVPIRVRKTKTILKSNKKIRSNEKVILKSKKQKMNIKGETAKKSVDPPKKLPCKLLKADKKQLSSNFTRPNDKTQVYVLELEGGYCYVGQSENVVSRIQQHLNGSGSKFTRTHKPTGKLIQRLGNINGAGDSGERQETLLQMRARGIDKVRGWKYVSEKLSKSQIQDIKENMIEMFSLCRVCASSKHLATQCPTRKRR